MNHLTHAVTGVVLLATAVGPAQAQDRPEAAPPEVFTEVTKCRDIAEGTARLACYDAAVAGLARAQEARQLIVMTREDVREARRGLFGFSLPKIRLFGGGGDEGGEKGEEEFTELTSTIASFNQGSRGVVFSLPDGAVWEQTDRIHLGSLREGQTVVIKRGALGSYFAKVGTSRAARVKRIR